MKKTLLTAICGMMLAACSSTPDPTLVDLTITSDADLNPDLTSRPSPMVVKLVELKSHTAFENADYFALAGNTKGTLGPDFIAEETMPVRPGEIKKLKLRLHAKSRFIGVIAEYRAIDKAVWRYVIKPDKEELSDIRISLTRDAIRALTKADKDDDKDEAKKTSINTTSLKQQKNNAESGYKTVSGAQKKAESIGSKPSFNLDAVE
jgi:type VI secretion system protein VasD